MTTGRVTRESDCALLGKFSPIATALPGRFWPIATARGVSGVLGGTGCVVEVRKWDTGARICGLVTTRLGLAVLSVGDAVLRKVVPGVALCVVIHVIRF